MTGAPSGGISIALELTTPGVWTDVTADFDNLTDIVITYGQTSEFSAPQTANLTLSLDNTLGKYTPGRQLLADNTTTHPYYPNIDIRKRIRVQHTTGVTTYTDFIGSIKAWLPILDPNGGSKVQISAATREDKLSTVYLLSPLMQEAVADNPAALWPLTDASGSTTATDVVAGQNMGITQVGAGGSLVFGGAGINSCEGTSATLTAAAANAGGQYLSNLSGNWVPQASSSANLSYAVECWFNTTSLNSSTIQYLWVLSSNAPGGNSNYDFLTIDATGNLEWATAIGPVITTLGKDYADGNWHQAVISYRQGTGTWFGVLFVDGVSQATGSGVGGITATGTGGSFSAGSFIGKQADATLMYRGQLGANMIYAGITSGLAVLSSARVATHFAAGQGFIGDTTDQRIARYLGYAGLTSANWNLDTGVGIVGQYPTAGVSVVKACQDMAVTEGGGACIYQTPDGLMRFPSRTFRAPGSPVLTFDAAADMDGPSFVPSLDDSTIVDQSVATQGVGADAGATFTVTNQSAVSKYGLIGDQVTSYATLPSDVLNLAQEHVAAQSVAALRLQTVTLDLYTAQTSGLYDALPSVQIGSRIRATNLPSHSPVSQLDIIVEGWVLTINVDKFLAAFVTSAADNPARFMWSTPLAYSRWGPDPSSMTLSGGITAAATTIVVATSGTSPTFDTAAGSYPLSIQIGAEVITFPTAPSGGTSPQTFTGAQRGQSGTTAAPQSNGAAVNLWPAPTWTL